MDSFEKLEQEVMEQLALKLPAELHYHTAAHTQDVMAAAERIALAEGINKDDITIIKMAALFHDSGYMIEKENHEENGCTVATDYLLKYDYESSVIYRVCDMIMATKVPQLPLDNLAEILCDADLDYLGRDDFFTISDKLYMERKALGIVETKNDWNLKQIDFLKQHRYFTATCAGLRNEQKQKHIDTLMAQVEK